MAVNVEKQATSINNQKVTFTYSLTENGTYGLMSQIINAGTYTVYYKVNANYHNEETGSFEVTIDKAKPTVTVTSAKDLKYTGNALTLLARHTSTGGTLLYKLGDGEYSSEIPTATLVGEYTVYYKVIGDSNYLDITENSINVTIAENSKTQLSSVVNSANTYYASLSTRNQKLYAELQTEINSAMAVINNQNATAEQIEQAVTKLNIILENVKEETTPTPPCKDFCLGWYAMEFNLMALIFALFCLITKEKTNKFVMLIVSAILLVLSIVIILIHTCLISEISLIISILLVVLYAFMYIKENKVKTITK